MSELAAAPAEASTESTGQNAPVESNQQAAPQEPPKPSKRQYKYKADGQDIAEELDDNELASRLALSKTANRKMQEAAQQRKQVEQLLIRLKENPSEVLLDDRVMGSKKFREIAEQFLIEQIQLEQMTPEERMHMEKDKKLSEYERQEKQRAEDQKRQQESQQEQMWAERYEKTIIDTLEKTGLPKNPRTIARMASALQTALKHGIDADSATLAEMVNNDYRDELKAVAKDATAEQLLALFGDELVNKIRKHDLSKLQLRNPQPKPSAQSTQQQNLAARMTQREFDEQLRAKFQK